MQVQCPHSRYIIKIVIIYFFMFHKSLLFPSKIKEQYRQKQSLNILISLYYFIKLKKSDFFNVILEICIYNLKLINKHNLPN